MSEIFNHMRRVEFCETDAAGIVYFASFLTYMEQAEHALYRHIGTSVMTELSVDQGPAQLFGWPRVHCESSFQGVAKFEDVLRILVTVDHLGTKSVRYRFTITKIADELAASTPITSHAIDISEVTLNESPIATGTITAVCCRMNDNRLESVPIPDQFRRSLSQFHNPLPPTSEV